MEQDKQRPHEGTPKHAPGGLVGNYQDSDRKEDERQDADCERSPGHLVGNFQRGQPECDPASPEPPADAGRRNAVGGQPPPLDGELSPHEESSDKAKAAVKRG